ncbi:MAG: DUF4197 domain-containing protein [Magnetococcales bacterium]|nr:DUF4197 domain-containing protein [Magnetococcales bacterium]
MKIKILALASTLCLASLSQTQTVQAGWMDMLDSAKKTAETYTKSDTATPPTQQTALSQGEMNQGLKEALVLGIKQAVATLGKEGGYLNDAQVKIPLPPLLASATTFASGMGLEKLTDQFIVTLNQAAEKAVPVALTIFVDAVKQMSLTDAQKILQGPDNAATDYFKQTSSKQLISSFQPIVEKTTGEVGLTSAYKKIEALMKQQGGAGGMVSGLSSLVGQDTFDLDGYVTQKAVDGLFVKLAEEEKKIRANPMAQGSQLLQKVFGFASGK